MNSKMAQTILFLALLFPLTLSATSYEVGSGKTYTSILEIATHNLQAGDSIKVYYKPIPYFKKH